MTLDTEQTEMEGDEFMVEAFDWTVEETVKTMEEIKTPDLTPTEMKQLQEVMEMLQHSTVFSTNPGRTAAAQHNIYVTDSTPIPQKQYRLPYSRQKVVEDRVQNMLHLSLIHSMVFSNCAG